MAIAPHGISRELGNRSSIRVSSTSAEVQFWSALTLELLQGCGRFVSGNVDPWRFKRSFSPVRSAKDLVSIVAGAFGFHGIPDIPFEFRLEKLYRTYELLHDEESRDLLVKLMAFWILGHRRVCLPLNTAEYWKLRSS